MLRKPKGLRTTGASGDIRGGVSAALLGLPVELVYGLFAVAPLGLAYAEHGMRAALWGCILGGIFVFLLRGTGGLLTGTRPAPSLILATLATLLLDHPQITASADPAAYIFTLLLLCTALAGFFQLLFGLANAGRILNFIPYPVVAGLMLGVGMLMLLGSLRPALGADNHTAWSDLPNDWHPATLAITIVALALCYLAAYRKSLLPGSLLALIVGTLLHQGLNHTMGQDELGGTLAEITSLLPTLTLWNSDIGWSELLAWIPFLFPYALTIAVLASLETLLCLSVIGNSQATRPDTNRAFGVQGLANVMGGLAGATTSVGNLPRVSANIEAGARTGLSNLVYALTLAGLVALLGNQLSLVPQAVSAAIVIYYALGMVDGGTRRIVAQLISQRDQAGQPYYRMLLANLSVILIVAAVAVFGDMMKAVGIGVVAAMVLFVSTWVKSAIRRLSYADRRRSLKVRPPEDSRLLDREGGQIAIIEVEGPLFFGTAENIAIETDRIAAGSSTIILDFKHVSDIDTTGAQALLRVSRKLAAANKRLLFSGLDTHFQNFLDAMGLKACIPRAQWHPDLDHALEEAEDHLLVGLGGHSPHQQLTLGETAIANGLDATQVEILESYLVRMEHPAAAELFRIGDPGESLFIASGSSVDIMIPLADGRHKRVISLAPGVFFGELSVLEGKPRSATARLNDASTVWELTGRQLDHLLATHPDIARQVLFNVGCQLAIRLRSLTSELLALDGGPEGST